MFIVLSQFNDILSISLSLAAIVSKRTARVLSGKHVWWLYPVRCHTVKYPFRNDQWKCPESDPYSYRTFLSISILFTSMTCRAISRMSTISEQARYTRGSDGYSVDR